MCLKTTVMLTPKVLKTKCCSRKWEWLQKIGIILLWWPPMCNCLNQWCRISLRNAESFTTLSTAWLSLTKRKPYLSLFCNRLSTHLKLIKSALAHRCCSPLPANQYWVAWLKAAILKHILRASTTLKKLSLKNTDFTTNYAEWSSKSTPKRAPLTK